jgi:S-adenosylmethionine decarboxylase
MDHTPLYDHDAEVSATEETDANWPSVNNDSDFFVEKDGLKFAGTHLLLDLWGASNLDDPDSIGHSLEEAARASGATILHTHMHHFTPTGVSGVVVLAESHISIHTWPEKGFAAVDVFMCGSCDPYKAVQVVKRAFTPSTIGFSEHRRGLLP